MKIREGFVSNSSSTSFVVVLPDGFSFTPEMAVKFDCGLMESRSAEEAANIINEKITDLRKEGFLPQDQDGYGHTQEERESHNAAFEALLSAFRDKELVVTGVDVDSGSGGISAVGMGKLKDIVAKWG
jgi:hypothetical protein